MTIIQSITIYIENQIISEYLQITMRPPWPWPRIPFLQATQARRKKLFGSTVGSVKRSAAAKLARHLNSHQLGGRS